MIAALTVRSAGVFTGRVLDVEVVKCVALKEKPCIPCEGLVRSGGVAVEGTGCDVVKEPFKEEVPCSSDPCISGARAFETGDILEMDSGDSSTLLKSLIGLD